MKPYNNSTISTRSSVYRLAHSLHRAFSLRMRLDKKKWALISFICHNEIGLRHGRRPFKCCIQYAPLFPCDLNALHSQRLRVLRRFVDEHKRKERLKVGKVIENRKKYATRSLHFIETKLNFAKKLLKIETKMSESGKNPNAQKRLKKGWKIERK